MIETDASTSTSGLWPSRGPGARGAEPVRPREALQALFAELIQQEDLAGEHSPASLFDSLYFPMAAWLADQYVDSPLLVGINGGQGSGKSTLCKMLKILLESGFDRRVVVISIDDLYLPRSQRQRLASRVHPLLVTRGVPGTHDVGLALEILSALKRGEPGRIDIPVFDKAMDDRAEPSRWQSIEAPVDIILFEGWCVGARAQTEQQLERAINILEASEDTGRQWRRYVNSQLAGPYAELFGLIDILIMLKVPSMDHVFEWRLLQENKLKQSLEDKPEAAKHIMTKKQLNRFIMHYERITRVSLGEMSARADLVLELNPEHQVSRVILNGV